MIIYQKGYDNMKYTILNNGIKMPLIGYGTDKMKGYECIQGVTNAIKYGYRLIDTAQLYGNEEEIGIAINNSIKNKICSREDIFVTTKSPFHLPGYTETLAAFDESRKKLDLEYIDQYILHQPYWDDINWKDNIIKSYRALEKLYKDKKVRSIGISNFHETRLGFFNRIKKINPQVHQFEISPFHQNIQTSNITNKNNIQIVGWGTLNQNRGLNHPILNELENKYKKTIFQIAIRWSIQKGNIALVRSSNINRLIQPKNRNCLPWK